MSRAGWRGSSGLGLGLGLGLVVVEVVVILLWLFLAAARGLAHWACLAAEGRRGDVATSKPVGNSRPCGVAPMNTDAFKRTQW